MSLPRGVLVTLLSLVAVRSLPADPPRTDAHGDRLPPGAVARLGTIRLRHAAIATAVAFSPDGKTLLSGDPFGAVFVWESATGKPLGRFPPCPHNQIFFVACCPDGKRAIVAGHRLPVVLCEVASGKPVRTFGEPQPDVRVVAVALSPNGKTLACGTSDGRLLRLWDVATGKELRQVAGEGPGAFARLAFAPDGKTLASTDERGRLRVWTAATGTLLHEWQAPANGMGLAFAPQGDTLAVGVWERICLLDSKTWKLRRYLSVPKEGSDSVVYSLAFAPDGRTLACGLSSGAPEMVGSLSLFDVATGKEPRRCGGRLATALALAFSPDGKTLASGSWDQVVHLWDVAEARERLAGTGHERRVQAVAFALAGKVVVSGSYDGTLRCWDWGRGQERYRVDAFRPRTYVGLAVSPDGAVVSTTFLEKVGVRLWDAATGKPLGGLGQPDDFAFADTLVFAPDGKLLAGIGWRGAPQLSLWNVATGKLARRFEPSPVALTTVAFAPDGNTLATGDDDGVLQLWDAATGKALRFMPHGGSVVSVAFSPDGRTVAGAGGDERAVRLWEVATGRQRLLLPHDATVTALAFAPDGRSLTAADASGVVYCWDATTGAELARWRGHQGSVSAVAYSPDGKQVVSCSSDTTLLLWDAAGALRRGRVKAVALSEREREALWRLLADEDAERAYAAVCRLAASPPQANALLRERLRPVPLPDARQAKLIGGWVADSASPRFGVRNVAMRELQSLGEMAVPALRAALGDADRLEQRRRLETLLAALDGPVAMGELLRGLRAVEALEHAGTEEARRLLEQLAGGAPHARLTREARGALERLARQRP